MWDAEAERSSSAARGLLMRQRSRSLRRSELLGVSGEGRSAPLRGKGRFCSQPRLPGVGFDWETSKMVAPWGRALVQVESGWTMPAGMGGTLSCMSVPGFPSRGREVVYLCTPRG